MNDTSDRLGRLAVVLAAVLLAVLVAFALFVDYAADLADVVGLLLVAASVPLAARVGGRIAGSLFPNYNVAEVAVEGPITRDGGSTVPTGAVGQSADDVVEQMERADEDDAVDALLVKLNTPGGEIVPSDDIRLAAERFDGPTVAYTTDVCASGGYWIASGCEELWAREGSVVGSIGVRGSRFTATGLLDQLGVDYEQFTAGEFKEAGVPFTDLDDEEREYLQGLIDDHYENFVETVAESRDLDPEFVRSTEAKVYLGEEAAELDLVDALGTREDVEDRLEERLDVEVAVREFEPSRGLAARFRGGAATVAYALGRGVADSVDGDADFRL
ncbi:signal peptide peptidase SppA [Halorarius halobius]|uniref:signal peptide peptidase SppA n=1 Tax=Halorarius halobius TaxID=2962671 RepID=UPI0020CD8266|nr:signal peptide peptidase SppA [Halorarius halobius]